MATVSLTRDAISKIVESETAPEGLYPVLLVVELRPISTAQSTAERYRMILSDGVNQQQAMLGTQLNHIAKSGALQKGFIVRLMEYVCSTVLTRKLIVVTNLEVVSTERDAIGMTPTNYSSSGTSQSRSPVPPQPSGVNNPIPAAGNPPSYGNSHTGGTFAQQNIASTTSLNPDGYQVLNNPSNGDPYGRNMSNMNPHQSGVDPGGGNFTEPDPNGRNQTQRFSNPTTGGVYRPPVTSYGLSGPPLCQHPPPIYTNRGPIAKNEAAPRIIPIAALNPYQGRWTIKARVTAKTELKRYSNPRGEGKVFSFDLLDSEGGEIRVTCFNMVADQFYDQVETGNVYFISKGSLKPSQKNFNHLNNDYEIFLESTSTITPCSDEGTGIPRQQFTFKSIDQIEGMGNNSMADVIGIVSAVYPAGTIMRKNGTETFKRTLQLKDMSGRSVELTLWGNFCNNEGQQLQALCESGSSPVLAVKAIRVSEFNGKSVGTIINSQLFIDPDFPEAHRLKEWYNREGKSMASLSISRETTSMGRTDVRTTVAQIKDEGLGRSEKPDWITVKANISFIKVDNFCYTACPLMVGDRKCGKKVSNNGDGTWRCERCDQSSHECEYRYMLSLQIQDHTGMTWVTAFQECAEEIMGLPAMELYSLKYEEQDERKFADVFQKVLLNQFLFKLRVKEDTYNDEPRLQLHAVKAERVNPSSESRFLLGLIEKLSLEDQNVVPGKHATFASGSQMSHAAYGNMESKPYGSVGCAGGYRVAQANQIGQHVNDYGGMNQSIGREPRLFCNNCGSAGHNFQNCPRANRQGPYMGGGFPNRSSNAVAMGGTSAPNACFKCQQPGHFARDCPGVNAGPSVYGAGSYAQQHVGGY